MNPHLCHLSRDARGLERSHRFLSRGRAVKVHEAISCRGWGRGAGGGTNGRMPSICSLAPALKEEQEEQEEEQNKTKKKPRRVAVANSDAGPAHPAFEQLCLTA